MGIEAPIEFGGSSANFFSSILAIEELAKVDGNISLFVDLQNTIMIPILLQYGSQELKDKYLTKLTKEMVFLCAIYPNLN
jgi:short-chain 2-methylacyl-CoA dehydrogenase